jgi:hypothetical protein
VLRRYTGAAEKDRAPDEMIHAFKAASGEESTPARKAVASEEGRRTLH